MSGFGGKAENICSQRVFRLLTLTGHWWRRRRREGILKVRYFHFAVEQRPMNPEDLIDLIGPTPLPCSLNPMILGEVDCGSYVRQTVEYAVEESERVKAVVFVPKDARRR